MPATPTTNSDDEETPLVASASRMTSSLRYSYGSPSMRQGKIVAVKQRAHHISNRLRWITNGTGLLCVFLFSGIIFGWAPLKLMLQREGQYSGLCDGSEDVGVVDGGEDTLPPPCVAQTVRFNRIFTAAQFFLSFASLPVGFFLDHSSKVIHFSVAAALEIAGLLLLAQADYRTETEEADIPFLDNFVIGYTLLALGGGMSMMGAFPASFLLPTYQGGILAAISCLFDANSIVFAVLTPLNAAHPVTLSRSNLLTGYAVLAALLYGSLAYCWSILEKYHWKLVVATESDAAQNDTLTAVEVVSLLDEQGENTNESMDAHARRIQVHGFHNKTLQQQLCTLDFLVVLVFASVQMLRSNFYIETVNELLLNVDPTAAVKYTHIFSFVLPLGVLFVPLIDGTVKKIGVVNTLHFTNIMGTVFGIFLLIPTLWAQTLNFIIFTGFRAFLYATLNTFIALTFGVSTMGRVIGAAFTTAAIVTLIQYPAATLAEDDYGGDFTVVNTMFLLAGMIIPGGLAWYYDRVVRSTPATTQATLY